MQGGLMKPKVARDRDAQEYHSNVRTRLLHPRVLAWNNNRVSHDALNQEG